MNWNEFKWINRPECHLVDGDIVMIQTEQETDMWQRTHYGYKHENAHSYLIGKKGDFTFKVKTSFQYNKLYDQCGILLFIDNQNWVKVSCEFENQKKYWLGSVVTNLGYSDWSTSEVDSSINEVYYKLSYSNEDVVVEYSLDDLNYKLLRIAHLHAKNKDIQVGVYACSPLDSTFQAIFSEAAITGCESIK